MTAYDGIWRRLMLVPFTVEIPPDEVDPALPERLRDELPGVLAWALRGCREWQNVGLQPPRAVTDAVAAYRTEMDIIGEFIAERCVLSPTAQAPASELYREYRSWCDEAGHHAVSSTRFGLALGERGFERRKPRTIVWHGIGLQSDSSDSCDPCRSSPYTRARDSGYAEKGSETVGLSDKWEISL